jgi:hypothetical protein
MSSGALKGIEVVLIAGAVAWFAYSQLNALKRDDTKTSAAKDTSGGTETATDDDTTKQETDSKAG